MTGRIRFTRNAEDDIFNIYEYTAKTHGARQLEKYEMALKAAFEVLEANPEIGVDRSALRPGTRRYLFESHAIYYEVDRSDILVLRILNVKQDPGRHL
ncbi:toxin ParE1/3/4 [Rhizobium sp. PP-F2F-G48]|uniref:type II toxin-antitoxin system RelE/ParE family toxin n=1 Tax=Rhizobium sp. PP-F2F-G48 TaxID=2135651 RepID=UPI0010E349C7|nr:type II toxin-antitoxin system RelE/ParE family toxin [Rhizobium sp. PP-F2F-G48]TCM58965.1 toxin ParE1/3/4 [Rhizobium sp. PP-F2F-G48]